MSEKNSVCTICDHCKQPIDGHSCLAPFCPDCPGSVLLCHLTSLTVKAVDDREPSTPSYEPTAKRLQDAAAESRENVARRRAILRHCYEIVDERWLCRVCGQIWDIERVFWKRGAAQPEQRQLV